MFGYKLIKESRLMQLEIIEESYGIINEDWADCIAINRDLKAENRELQETICEYGEALEQMTAQRNHYFDAFLKMYDMHDGS